jgi:poly(A) polymerase
MTGLEAAKTIVQRLRDRGHTALLAGGCVRDRLLGLTPTDYDVATDATPAVICQVFRRTKHVGAQFGVVLVRMDGVEVEVATFRTDVNYRDGRRPESVVFATPQEDARRRDFTINGMFLDPFDDTVVDYVGGRQDLADKRVRCIGEPDARFAEDHLRMLRAVRFAARLGFAIEAQTHAAIRRHAPRISAISAERVRMELEMVLGHPSRAEGWRLIVETGLVNHLVHGVTWSEAQCEHIRRVLLELPADVSESLGFAGILSCFSTDRVRAACQELRCSTAVTRAAMYLVDAARRTQQGPIRELADVKFLLASGHAHESLALAHALTIVEGTDPVRVAELIGRCERIAPEDYAPPPLVTGDDLIAMKLPPGPRYREILDQLYRAQLNEGLTARADGLDRARALVKLMT